jgi:putative hydrolase of HD superfamily
VNADSVLQLLLYANQLKRIPRTGWVMRGVADAESVSDHSFGVAFIALLLAQMVEQSVDIAKLLTIALLHDLPEAVLSDVPATASNRIPPQTKREAEDGVLSDLLDELPQREQWRVWWGEFEDGTSVEANLVRDADRLDMLIQARVYEQTTGNRWLVEFWAGTTPGSFQFAAARSLFEALRELGAVPGRSA